MDGSLMSLRKGVTDHLDMSNIMLDKTVRDIGQIIFTGVQCKKKKNPYVNTIFFISLHYDYPIFFISLIGYKFDWVFDKYWIFDKYHVELLVLF